MKFRFSYDSVRRIRVPSMNGYSMKTTSQNLMIQKTKTVQDVKLRRYKVWGLNQQPGSKEVP